MIAIAHAILGAEEEIAVLQILRSGMLTQGEYVATFEQRFAEKCHVDEAVAVSSGAAALLLALLAHHIGPGDEVITTAFNGGASANAILLVGASPVFVDIEADTYTLDLSLVEMALTRRTKAVIATHIYGNPCDMRQLEPFTRAHDLVLIEDASQAHIAMIDGKPVGSFGTGCFSFYETKTMTTGEGGMVTTNDPAIAEQIRLLRNEGQVGNYQQTALGYNARMTEMQGALGVTQLEKLEYFTERRIANATFLTTHLQGHVQTPIAHPGYRHVYHTYTIRVPEKRNEWAIRLRAQDIETSVRYSLPVYRKPFYRQNAALFRVFQPEKKTRAKRKKAAEHLPVTERATHEVLSLPVHPALSQEDLDTIVREVLALST